MKAAQIGCHVAMSYLMTVNGADAFTRGDVQDLLAEACAAGFQYPPGEGHRATVQFLIRDRGATSNRRTRIGSRRFGFDKPIHLAALSGNFGAVDALIRCGADVKTRGQYKRTALHNALMTDGGPHQDLVSLLLEEGSDLFAMDTFGHTAIDYIKAVQIQGANGECVVVDQDLPSRHPELSDVTAKIFGVQELLKVALQQEMINLAISVLQPKLTWDDACVPLPDAKEKGKQLCLSHRQEMADRMAQAKRNLPIIIPNPFLDLTR